MSPPRTHAAAALTARASSRSVWALARRIPRGRVATYGQLAALLGQPRGARAVGWALARWALPDERGGAERSGLAPRRWARRSGLEHLPARRPRALESCSGGCCAAR